MGGGSVPGLPVRDRRRVYVDLLLNFHLSQHSHDPVLWRRLELLNHCDTLRWPRRPPR